MAIGYENQFYLSFAVGDQKDFMQAEDLLEFTEVSEAGNVLPTFQVVFWTSEERVFGLLNEGNDLLVSFGRNLSESRDYILHITKMTAKNSLEGRHLFSCVGVLSRMKYVSNTRRRIIGPFSGVEGMKQVVEENGFTWDSNVDSSADEMRWIQANNSDRKFVSDMWKHSYIANSFLAMGITSDGRFVLRDVRKMGRETDPVWTFSLSADGSKDTEILYDPDPDYEYEMGFVNYWAGYGQERAVFSLEDEDLRFISEDVKPVIALTDQVARRAELEKRYQSTALQNENVHPNYWKAALQNLTNVAVLSSFKVVLTFRGTFKDVKVLDLVSFFDPSIAGPTAGSSMAQSGLYIVAKVARNVSGKQLVTTVVMCREAVNDVSGSIREAEPAEEFDEQFGVAGTEPEPVE
jgi:hypothetical protein